jgi:hypothetical protein
MSRILVSGMIAGDPYQGGATWAVLQYVLGLRRLGHDVWFIEPVKDDFAGKDYFAQVIAEFGLTTRAAVVRAGTRETIGVPYSAFPRADILLNISGMLTDPALIGGIPVRIYLDLDPAFNQLWHVAQGVDTRFAGHTHFVTIGQAIGDPDCPVPACGLEWIPALQPVVLEHWPAASAIRYDALTTVGNWRGYGSIQHQGTFYGQKAHSLRQFISLPRLTRERFLLAMSIHAEELRDLAALVENGWELLDPAEVAGSPAAYRQFIQQSRAEFGIAKSGYVASRCGWFSDRSVCYLASGRPVIAQDTGFSRFLPTGAGLFAFRTREDVLTAIDALRADYRRHSEAARALAEEYFDSDKVLTRLLEKVA